MNIVISLLVDGEYTGTWYELAYLRKCIKCDDVLVDCVCAEIDVQLVGLVKTLIDPDNIMTDAAAVVSHMTIT